MRQALFVTLLLLGAPALGIESSRVPYASYLSEQLERADTILQAQDAAPSEACFAGEEWFQFRRFSFRIRPNVTFTVGVAHIAIEPEIEIMWQKDLPQGWELYQGD